MLSARRFDRLNINGELTFLKLTLVCSLANASKPLASHADVLTLSPRLIPSAWEAYKAQAKRHYQPAMDCECPSKTAHALSVTFVNVKIPAEDMSLVRPSWERCKQFMCVRGLQEGRTGVFSW